MESQLELWGKLMEQVEKFQQVQPDVMSGEQAVMDIVYKDGALDLKVKRLIALGVALRAGCTACILAQTKRAVEAGARKDEVFEAISVAVSMSGTTGICESLRVIKLLEELGVQ
jgi:AhpD family alkylhydroperoxidase